MICKNCGTESREDFCPHCGEMLRPGSVPPPISQKPSAATEDEPSVMSLRVSPYKKMDWRISDMIWPALALLLPLAYLFFESFAVLSDALFVAGEDGTPLLHALMRQLSDVAAANIAYADLRESLLGQDAVLYTAHTALSVLQTAFTEGFTPLLVPILTQTVLIGACVPLSLLLLFSGGRVLRWRAVTGLTVFVGTGATLSPLLGKVLLQLYCYFNGGAEAAELAMQRIHISPEALCIMGILLCTVTPALRHFCSLSAMARGELTVVYEPFRLISKAPFLVTKLLTLGAILLSMGLLAAMFFLPISPFGAAYDVLALDWGGTLAALQGVTSGAGDIGALAVYMLKMANFWWMPALCGSLLSLLIAAIRVVFMRQARLAERPSRVRLLCNMGEPLRNGVLAPFISFFVLQVVMTVILLVLTPVLGHIDFSNVPAALELLHLTVGYVVSFGSTGTLYVFVGLGGALLWTVTEQLARAMLLSAAPHRTDI